MKYVSSVEKINLPNGDYTGLWSGDMVGLNFGGKKLMFKVTYDIKRRDVVCKIFMKDNIAYILPQ